MVAKINISIAEDLLRQLDEEAREARISRSGLVALAARHYIEERARARELQHRQEAAKEIDRIRESAPPWDATAEVLEWREKH